MSFLNTYIMVIFEARVMALRTILPLLLSIAFYTLCERKLMASIQRRRGPTEVGLFGLLQAFSDGLKLLFKEVIIPIKRRLVLFFFSPIVLFTLSLTNWGFLRFDEGLVLVDSKYSVLGILAISSLSVYGIIFAGWSSGSRYPFLGSVRAAAQLISYELTLTLSVLTVRCVTNSFNLVDIIIFQQNNGWLIFYLFPVFVLFFITGLAETNRTPFDLPEAEAELVAGYNLEYSSIPFRLFFLGEYCNMLVISVLIVSLFMGGSWNLLILKRIFVRVLFVVIRAALPRFRYDQLIEWGWLSFLPRILSIFIFISIVFLVDSNLESTSIHPLRYEFWYNVGLDYVYLGEIRVVK